MTTDVVEAAQKDFESQVLHREGVDTMHAKAQAELAAGEAEYKKLAYEFSRSENGEAEGVEASLRATRDTRIFRSHMTLN